MCFRPVSKYLSTAILVLISAGSVAAVEMLDRVVAVVDSSVVTQTELDDRIHQIETRSKAAGMRLPDRDVLQEQIIEQLINEALQLNAANRYGVTVSDQELLTYVRSLMQQQNWTEEQLVAEMAKEGLDLEGFKRQIYRQLLMQNISQGLVRSRIKISDQDIDNFLNSADAKFWISPDYNLSHILVAVAPSANPNEVKLADEKANSIYQRLLSGEKFEELALAESDGQLSLQGGALGWRKSAELPTLFAEIAPELDVNEISKPARSRAGYHILRLNAKRGETKQIVQQSKVRHILLKTSAILNDTQAKAKLLELRQSVIDGEAEFSELAKEYSEDIGSKLGGGDLGWSLANDFVPAFAFAVNSATIGEISEPFQSQFGWHILVVDDRRDEDMTDQAIRVKARNLLTSRRFEDEVQLWIQEMRDEAFIDIKI